MVGNAIICLLIGYFIFFSSLCSIWCPPRDSPDLVDPLLDGDAEVFSEKVIFICPRTNPPTLQTD